MVKTAVVFPQILHRLNELTNLQHLAQSLTQNKYSIKVVLRTGKKKKKTRMTPSLMLKHSEETQLQSRHRVSGGPDPVMSSGTQTAVTINRCSLR